VISRTIIRNDGTYTGKDIGEVLVNKGDIGYVRSIGTFLQQFYIYAVEFTGSGHQVGMRAKELCTWTTCPRRCWRSWARRPGNWPTSADRPPIPVHRSLTMMEPAQPKYDWGQRVRAVIDLVNDGSFPEAAEGELLVPAGASARSSTSACTPRPMCRSTWSSSARAGCWVCWRTRSSWTCPAPRAAPGAGGRGGVMASASCSGRPPGSPRARAARRQRQPGRWPGLRAGPGAHRGRPGAAQPLQYVPRVLREGLGWKVVSPNCSRNIDREGGEIDIAWLVPTQTPDSGVPGLAAACA
jgi:hypothetical protein